MPCTGECAAAPLVWLMKGYLRLPLQIMREGDFVLRNALFDWGGGLVQGWDVVFYGDSITEE